MKKWERVAWDGLVMCKGEKLVHQWGRVILYKSKGTKRGKGRPRITLIEVVNWHAN